MKKRLITASIVANVAFLATLLWMRTRYEGELHEMTMVAASGDEQHLKIHAISLAAIESGDPEKTAAAVRILRPLIAAGDANMEARERSGLWK